MAPLPSGQHLVRFGVYQCDLRSGELYKNGRKVKLSNQPFRLLALLLERRGELVTRQELRERLWPNEEFGEFNDGLNTAINKVRAALEDSADNPRFVETIPRHGYRFIAPVEFETTAEKETPPVGRPVESSTGGLSAHGERPVATAASGASTHNRGRFGRIVSSVAAALIVGIAVTYGWWHLREHVTSAAKSRIRSIAVLPFDNFSGDPSQDFLAEGMTDELTTELAQVGSLRVTSRSSAVAYGSGHKSIRQIRGELGVDAVVEGSVAREGHSVRVDARLVKTSDDREIWAQSFTRNERDILELEDDIARAVTERIEVAIDPDVRERLETSRPVNAAAVEAYLHGSTYVAHHSDADLLKSLDYFKQAVAIDPTFAEAYAAEAQDYCYLGDYSVLPDSVAWPQAEMAAERALSLDDTIARAHAARAFALWRYDWNWKVARAEFQRSLALNPNDADTHHLFGLFLATTGDFSGAARQLQAAQRLDPLSLIIRTNIGWLHYYQRDYATAIADYRGVLQSDPRYLPAAEKLWIAYALHGDAPQAGAELVKVFRLYHQTDLSDRIGLQADSGNPEAQLRAEVLAYANSGFLTNYERSRYLAVAGDEPAALESLLLAESKRDSWLVYAGIEPAFDSLRSSTRFSRLLAQVGLQETERAKVTAEVPHEVTPRR
jgi:TolB-like protein/DNA-binding winged helix-turn-helix (wHTH) protein